MGLFNQKALLVLGIGFCIFYSFAACLMALLGTNPPFQGKEPGSTSKHKCTFSWAVVTILSAIGTGLFITELEWSPSPSGIYINLLCVY